MTKTFIQMFAGADAGDAFLASSYADMAAYPPTGIGQKHGFIQLSPANGERARDAALRYIEQEGSPIFGVNAPAGCIKISDQEFLFFGWVRDAGRLAASANANQLEDREAA